jgi:hypothetical protein
MPCTLMPTEEPESGIRAIMPALPARALEARRAVREVTAQLVRRRGIAQTDMPRQPRATEPLRGVPGEWFGEATAGPLMGCPL